MWLRRPAYHSRNEVERGSSACAGAIEWNYDRAEVIADILIHAVGVTSGLIAATALVAMATVYVHGAGAVSVGVYSICLETMLVLSATYNLWPISPAKWLLRRFDHSAIYALIAATYTPLITELGAGTFEMVLLVGLWSIAAVGVSLKLALPGRFDRLSIAIYLVMGWSGLLLYHTLLAGAPVLTVRLVLTGGLLYTAGVPFHIWQRLRFQNAIWHCFVLLAAACHCAAIFVLQTS
ncbi:MAG: hemolysin III family protein [Bradyrhizobium sp.]|uniref:PAQR family membrane homeostasis protein TrhA n=1 Tax=Bradyrhizobium sp. TaxID=376 RepID=UPI001C29744A|nr:hemolysin III family protein [Bradyrhizobium sp.]MBU6462574.1 hemolysin III family protein [Pseudomonadota bacterium]MDE2067195.1 hemolysin III family protein [Bradyrhizobium sp.]